MVRSASRAGSAERPYAGLRPMTSTIGGVAGSYVFDNLVPSSFYGIAARGRSIRFLRRAPVTRPVEMLLELGDLASSGYPPSDALQFTLVHELTAVQQSEFEQTRAEWQAR